MSIWKRIGGNVSPCLCLNESKNMLDGWMKPRGFEKLYKELTKSKMQIVKKVN